LVQLSEALVEAILGDPSSGWARYDLACLDNLLGTTHRAAAGGRRPHRGSGVAGRDLDRRCAPSDWH
jgi:hypothetical protein